MVVTGFSVIAYGLPAYVTFYPQDQQASVFVATLVLTFLYVLRYYCMLSFNTLSGDGRHLFDLPPALKTTLFIKLSVLSLLCLVSAGAITSLRAEWALLACAAMSALAFAVWLVCWALSLVGRMPRVQGVYAFEEALLFVIMAVITTMVFLGADNRFSASLPFVILAVIFIFGNRLVKTYLPALRADFGELRTTLRAPAR